MATLLELPPTADGGLIHVVIESPRGATSKIKYDEELQVFTLQRSLPLGLAYPHDWGFVPGTRAEDGDPLDALVLSEGTTYPGMVVRARPLALVKVEQDAPGGGRQRNDRVLAAPDRAPRATVRSFEDLPARVREEIDQFFLNVTFFQNKNVRVLGWEGPERALDAVSRLSRTGLEARRSRGGR